MLDIPVEVCLPFYLLLQLDSFFTGLVFQFTPCILHGGNGETNSCLAKHDSSFQTKLISYLLVVFQFTPCIVHGGNEEIVWPSMIVPSRHTEVISVDSISIYTLPPVWLKWKKTTTYLIKRDNSFRTLWGHFCRSIRLFNNLAF